MRKKYRKGKKWDKELFSGESPRDEVTRGTPTVQLHGVVWSHVFIECELSTRPCLPCVSVAIARKLDRDFCCDGRGLLTKQSKEKILRRRLK